MNMNLPNTSRKQQNDKSMQLLLETTWDKVKPLSSPCEYKELTKLITYC